jgi:hypothetical protein
MRAAKGKEILESIANELRVQGDPTVEVVEGSYTTDPSIYQLSLRWNLQHAPELAFTDWKSKSLELRADHSGLSIILGHGQGFSSHMHRFVFDQTGSLVMQRVILSESTINDGVGHTGRWKTVLITEINPEDKVQVSHTEVIDDSLITSIKFVSASELALENITLEGAIRDAIQKCGGHMADFRKGMKNQRLWNKVTRMC